MRVFVGMESKVSTYKKGILDSFFISRLLQEISEIHKFPFGLR